MDTDGLRKRSIGTVEINDAQGHTKTVDVNELSEADKKLAAEFGYKPVCDNT